MASKWTTEEYENEVHVVPCDEEGVPLSPHERTEHCTCNPDLEQHKKLLVIHHDFNPSRDD